MRSDRPVVTPSKLIMVLLSLTLLSAGSASAQADPPKGVLGCCLPDLTCVNLNIIDCITVGGIRQPRVCSGASCGACCTASGCIDSVVESVCTLDLAGEYGGDQSDCSGFCLPGACCLPGGACEIRMSGLDCAGQGGLFQGVGTDCAGVICRGCGILGSVDTPRAVLDIEIAGSLAYVAVGNDGLFVIDVSDPTAPSIIGSVDPGSVSGVALSGSTAYVADPIFDGMHVIDISDPANPAVVGSVVTVGDFDQRVAVSGTIACVPDSFFLHVIDVSNPATPVAVGSVGLDFGSGVAIAGTVAYAVDSVGLRAVNISDPANPATVGFVATGSETHDVVVSGTTAYVASDSGLHAIDVSDLSNPTIIGFLGLPDVARGVALSGTVAYVANDDFGVQLVDVSDPSNPMLLKSIDLPDPVNGIAVSGAMAFASEDTGLSIINASSCGRGVCCLTDGCIVTSAAACASITGTYLGDGTVCATATCPPTCVSDVDGDQIIGFSDVLQILTEWGPCPEAE